MPTPPCQVCKQGPDEAYHALFQCHFSVTFWFASPLTLRATQLPQNPHLLLAEMCACVPDYQGTDLNHHAALNMALSYNHLSLAASNLRIPKGLAKLWPQQHTTSAPGVTAFLDGSYKEEEASGWAYIITTGSALLQYGMQSGWAAAAFDTELMALQLAVTTLIQLGLRECTLYTDCAVLQQIVSGALKPDQAPWHLLPQIMKLLELFRVNVGFSLQSC